MKCLGRVGVSMKWEVADNGPNKMPNAIVVERESFERVNEQTFSKTFVEDEQWFKEF